MRKTLLLMITAGILLALVSLVSAESGLKEGWSAPADSREYGGRIVRPTLHPTNPDWMSFEVRQNDGVKLFIYNLEKGEPRELQPPAPESDMGGSFFSASGLNQSLVWRPQEKGGQVWAAFISNVTGNNELFLYEANSDKYYHFLSYHDTSQIGSKSNPAWSPDGKCLTYTTRSAGNADIWLVRGMDKVLKDPESEESMQRHEPLVIDEGDQFGAVWSPVPDAAYIAYNHIAKGSGRVELRFVDPRYRATFELVAAGSSTGYFAPSWSPSGKEIGYYQYDMSGESHLGDDLEPTGDSYGLGLAGVRSDGDTLVVTPMRGGGRTGTQDVILEVAPNIDRYRGPAWTPDGYQMVVPIYDEAAHNPIKAIVPFEWNTGARKRDWQQNFGGGVFDFPRDLMIAKDGITFTYSLGQGRALMSGKLEHMPSFDAPVDYLSISRNRQGWYKEWSEIKSPGFFAKAGRFLFAPIGGKELGLNRWIVPIGVATYFIFKPGDDELPPPLPRNWSLPSF
ncbi:MAG: hypothetical protein P1R58_11500 [bacterium]|nr:hypothetical protein [bacterium]